MTKSKTPKTITEAQAELDRIIAAATAVRNGLDNIQALPATDEPAEDPRLAEKDAEIRFWQDLVKVISDISSGRPEISSKRGKDAWQGTALLQSSLLAEISRTCANNLRSKKKAPRPIGMESAIGPKTGAMAERAGCHIHLQWTRLDVNYKAVIFEPSEMDVTPALVDLLVFAVEMNPMVDTDRD